MKETDNNPSEGHKENTLQGDRIFAEAGEKRKLRDILSDRQPLFFKEFGSLLYSPG